MTTYALQCQICGELIDWHQTPRIDIEPLVEQCWFCNTGTLSPYRRVGGLGKMQALMFYDFEISPSEEIYLD